MAIQSIALSNSRPSTFRPGTARRPATGFEQTLAQGQLRRIEAKELLFAEGDTISHVYRIETGALAL
jgi:CRP-like cAMP-binding protein